MREAGLFGEEEKIQLPVSIKQKQLQRLPPSSLHPPPRASCDKLTQLAGCSHLWRFPYVPLPEAVHQSLLAGCEDSSAQTMLPTAIRDRTLREGSKKDSREVLEVKLILFLIYTAFFFQLIVQMLGRKRSIKREGARDRTHKRKMFAAKI